MKGKGDAERWCGEAERREEAAVPNLASSIVSDCRLAPKFISFRLITNNLQRSVVWRGGSGGGGDAAGVGLQGQRRELLLIFCLPTTAISRPPLAGLCY